jgi:hypothetical protein
VRPRGDYRDRVALPRVLPAAALALTAACAVALWPATSALCLAVAAILLLAIRAPAWGLAAALLLFGFEGSVKILLGLEASPLPGSNREAGAALLDVALFGAIAAVAWRDRLEAPRTVWRAANRLERIALLMLGAWLTLSVVQIPQVGSLSEGLQGFRLFQAYTACAVAALVVFARPRLRMPATRVLLAIAGVVATYAAFRVIVGPAVAEDDYATSVQTVSIYGGTVRAIGSFSSAVGLASFLTPVAVFGAVVGYLMPALRRLAWVVTALSIVGLVGSYSRSSLFALVLGLVLALGVVLAGSDVSLRRKIVTVGAFVTLVGVVWGAVLVTSQASPRLRERAHGIVHPLSDASMKLRFRRWKRVLRDVPDHPLGRGVGFIGAAAGTRSGNRTTDNSFLKVLVEQSVVGFLLFSGGLLAAIVALARRLRRSPGDARALGLSALAAFVAFLTLALVEEAVEQPGKVIAWGLLGVAAAQAWRPSGEDRAA